MSVAPRFVLNWHSAAQWYQQLEDLAVRDSVPLTLTATPWMSPLALSQIPVPEVINATVESVHDGDTFNVTVDWPKRRRDINQPIRLLGCNAYELSFTADDGSKPGVAARDNLATLLPPGSLVVLQTVQDDKFAPRWDAAVTYIAPDGTQRDLVTDLIAGQWVAAWNGVGKAPVPPWPRPGG